MMPIPTPKQRVVLQKALRLIGAGLAISLVSQSYAQEEDEPLVQFGGSLFVEGRYVDNANRTTVEAEQIEEVQLQYGGSLQAAVDRELIDVSADYDFYQNDYLEETQDDRFIHTGRSSLVFGTPTTFYQVDLSHSTQRFLVNREGPTILANTDQRDISSITPLLRIHPGRGQSNSIGAYGHFADVRYDELDINDSQRMGYGVVLERQITPVHTLGLNFSENDVDYRYVDEADYRYRRGVVSLAAELRLLTYRVDLGVNEAAPEQGETTDKFYYNFSVNHSRYGSNWNFTANRTITDTSYGNANNPFFSDGITADTSTTVQDQLELRSYGLAWNSNFLCERCTVGLRAGYEDEQYFNITAENQTEIFGGGSFAYLLRPSAELQLLLDHRRRQFEDQGDYSESRATIALEVDPVLKYFDTRLWYQVEQRNPEAGEGYYTNAVGLAVAYNF